MIALEHCCCVRRHGLELLIHAPIVERDGEIHKPKIVPDVEKI